MQNTTSIIFKPNDEFRRQANISGLKITKRFGNLPIKIICNIGVI